MGALVALLGHHYRMPECYFSRLPLALRLQRRSTLAGFLVNALAAALVGTYTLVVFPPEQSGVFYTREVAAITVAVYTVISGITAHRRVRPLFAQMREWLAAGRPPTDDERRAVLRAPARFAQMTINRWALAVPIFALPNLSVSTAFALEVATIVVLAGLTVSAAAYLTL